MSMIMIYIIPYICIHICDIWSFTCDISSAFLTCPTICTLISHVISHMASLWGTTSIGPQLEPSPIFHQTWVGLKPSILRAGLWHCFTNINWIVAIDNHWQPLVGNAWPWYDMDFHWGVLEYHIMWVWEIAGLALGWITSLEKRKA